MLTEQELQDRLKQVNHVRPHILKASYEDGLMTLVLGGSAAENTAITFNPRVMPWLAELDDSAFENLRIFPDGAAVGLPAVNLDVPWNGVVKWVLGIDPAKTLGSKGGSATSEAKAAAVRANGAKGGRPRKKVDEPFSAEKLRQHLPKPESEGLGDAVDG